MTPVQVTAIFDGDRREPRGVLTRMEVEPLVRQCYDQSLDQGVDDATAATRPYALRLARDDEHALDIAVFAPDEISVYAGDAITGEDEDVTLTSFTDMSLLVDAYYRYPEDFAAHWRALVDAGQD